MMQCKIISICSVKAQTNDREIKLNRKCESGLFDEASVACVSLAGGEEEAHWKRHCYHSISGRGRGVIVLQTIYDPITLHPYPLHGQ